MLGTSLQAQKKSVAAHLRLSRKIVSKGAFEAPAEANYFCELDLPRAELVDPAFQRFQMRGAQVKELDSHAHARLHDPHHH